MKRPIGFRKFANPPKPAMTLFAAMLLLLTIPLQAQQVMHKHVRPAITNGQATPVGTLPTTQRLKFSFVLPLGDQVGLNSFLQELYDANSPNYHQFLSVEQFTEQFGPTRENYQAVVDYAKANGFNVQVTPNRLLVMAEGSVGDIQKAFHVTMTVYQHPTEARTFYSPDREPTLFLSVPLAHISGLSDYSIPHSSDLRRATIEDTVHTFTTGSGPGGVFLGSDFRAAYYGGSSLTGAGQTIGLFGLAYNINDVTAYFNSVGQSFNPGIVQGVSVDGSATSCNGCDDAEQMVDIMRSCSMAPGVSAIYEFIGGGNVGRFNAMATHNPLPLNLSSSISYDPEDPTAEEPIFQEFAAQGQSFFQASGDAGAYKPSDANGSSYYPAESTWVTPAGGTDLTTNGPGGSWQSETAWSGSGGGASPDGFGIPSWQVGLANSSNGASTTLRNLPDVASEANTDNYFCDMGSCRGGIGGTSLSAPLWAGFMALVNQQAAANGKRPAGFISPTVAAIGKSSSYTSNFHDISSGSNGHPAVAGYDLVTGWGTPNGQTLINSLAGGGSGSCTPTAITPFLQVNGAAWQQTASVSVASGSTVNLGPQPVTGGSWSWSGPNGFTSTARQLNSIPLSSGSNTFIATYTNPSGCKSTQTFTITVSGGGATPTPTPKATPTPTPGGGTTCATAWAAGVSYSVGQEVSYQGNNYTCLQAHTSQVGWEPPNVAALWKLVGSCH